MRASLEKDHPYDLRICLAPPVDLASVSSKIPERKSVFLTYSYNIFKALKSHALRDEIVKHHQSFWLSTFLRDPRIVSLRISDPRAFNATRILTPKLTDFITGVPSPCYLMYGGNDKRLGIQGELSGDYAELRHLAEKRGFEICLIQGLSHRFNSGKEREFVLSYDNDIVIEGIRDIVKRWTKKD